MKLTFKIEDIGVIVSIDSGHAQFFNALCLMGDILDLLIETFHIDREKIETKEG